MLSCLFTPFFLPRQRGASLKPMAANEFLASLEQASLSSPPKGPAPKPESQLAATAKSPVRPPAAPAQQPDQSNAETAVLAPPVQASSAADFLAAGAPPPPPGSATDFLASTNPNPDPTPARGTSAAEFLASTDGQRQASDPATLELQAERNAQRAVLFWSGGLCRTVFRAWQLATRLGRQAQQAGQQVFELYVGVEAVRFEAPQLEWLHEERITRLFLELHPLVTGQQRHPLVSGLSCRRLGDALFDIQDFTVRSTLAARRPVTMRVCRGPRLRTTKRPPFQAKTPRWKQLGI